MNIEDLTKSQIILLTLLVSFVTSIATGIVTVTLLEQAPPAVTQTVNRVIHNTVEKIVPQESGKNVETVIVKEEDLVVDAIDQNAKSLVAIKLNAGGSEGALLGTGFLVSKDGFVMTDSTGIEEGGNYFISQGGVSYAAAVAVKDERGFAILKIEPTKDEQGNFKSFASSAFGDSDALKVGQTVVAPSSLDGESLNVAKGIVSAIVADPSSSSTVASIKLTMNLGRANAGSPLLDTAGSVIGIVVSNGASFGVVPSRILKDALAGVPRA